MKLVAAPPTPLDRAFDAAGRISEHIAILEDCAADLDDNDLSKATFHLRWAVSVACDRLARLRIREAP